MGFKLKKSENSNFKLHVQITTRHKEDSLEWHALLSVNMYVQLRPFVFRAHCGLFSFLMIIYCSYLFLIMFRAHNALALKGSSVLFALFIFYPLEVRSQRPVGQLLRNFKWWSEVAWILIHWHQISTTPPLTIKRAYKIFDPHLNVVHP